MTTFIIFDTAGNEIARVDADDSREALRIVIDRGDVAIAAPDRLIVVPA